MAKVLTFSTETKRDLAAEDAAAREQALDPQRSFLVEAPAGSGKTALIVQRFLGQLLDEELGSPEEVLAITFTRKATAELQERVVKELAKAHKPLREGAPEYERTTYGLARAVLERSRAREWELAERPGRLNIRSIDSVCAAIAGSVPVLSGSGGPRAVLDDARTLYRSAARRTLFELGGSDAALHTAIREVLLHRDAQLADTESLLAGMLAAREQWGELIPLDPAELTDERLDSEVRPRLEAALEAAVCAGLSKALRLMPDRPLQELSEMASGWSGLPGIKGEVSPLEICRGKGSPSERAESLEHWRALIALLLKKDKAEWRLTTRSFPSSALKFEVPKGAGARLLELVEGVQSDRLADALHEVRLLPPAKYPDEQWAVAKSLFLVLRHALAELKLLFAERGECDFAELSLAARQALEAEPTLGDAALTGGGGRLRHLLVDEMQDTSAAQYELLEQLTRSWDGHSQTLFLVGDPKQSIYLFRQARVERFVRAAAEGRLGELPLQTLQLSINFRSQAYLVKGVNESVERLFPSDSKDAMENSDVPFVEAFAARPASLPQAFAWHPRVIPSGKLEMAAYRQQEALEVRQHIQRWQTQKLPADRKTVSLPDGRTVAEPWSIAVLARNRNHLAGIATELRRAGIAFKAVDVESLAERQEVLDAMALTRALLHPADRIAWLAVLRAPWCGLGLVDLLALTGEGAEADRKATVRELVETRRGLLSAEGERLLGRAWPVLEAAVEARGATGLATLVERTWRSLGGDLGLTIEARHNAERFFRLVSEVEALEPGRIDLRVLEAKLGDLYAEPTTLDPSAPSVELMTIHRAKGLEWDVVLVPGLERKPRGNRDELLNWIETDTTGVVLAPISGRGEPSSELNTWLRNIRTVRDRAERKRVFYVACTRAREELHLFAALPLTTKGERGKPVAGSLLEACWPAAGLEFERVASPTEATPNAAQEDGLDDVAYEPLALAAASDNSSQLPKEELSRHLPRLQRLLFGVQTVERFRSEKPSEPVAEPARLERPEGSFAARAFGNVMHRFLELCAERLATDADAAELAKEAATWGPRLKTLLCAEGIPPSLAEREAQRALAGLRRTLADPVGLWVLGPRSSATSEAARATGGTTLRADRIFAAGEQPGEAGDSHLWIVDFKTSERGSRAIEAFRDTELASYRKQLERYAALEHAAGEIRPIKLALFYPLDGTFLDWESEPLLEFRTLSL